MGTSIEGVISNQSSYVIQYHLQRTISYTAPVMTSIKISPSFSISSTGISGKLFQFYKKVEYFSKTLHSFVRVPPGRVCWPGLSKLPPRYCLLSVYGLCINEHGQIYHISIKKDVLISVFSDVCLRMRSDFSISNLSQYDARYLRRSSSNYCDYGGSLDRNYFLRIGQYKPAPNFAVNPPLSKKSRL